MVVLHLVVVVVVRRGRSGTSRQAHRRRQTHSRRRMCSRLHRCCVGFRRDGGCIVGKGQGADLAAFQDGDGRGWGMV